jgi:SNF2-related domain
MVTTGKGCLLAHTMGLGKTLQIIALLITLSLLPANAHVEMPEHLKKNNRRFLIICPPSIVVNWQNEFQKWTPEDCHDRVGTVFLVNQLSLCERMETVARWYENGGILISMSIYTITAHYQWGIASSECFSPPKQSRVYQREI